MFKKNCVFVLLFVLIVPCFSQEKIPSVIERLKALEEANYKLREENFGLKEKILELEAKKLGELEQKIEQRILTNSLKQLELALKQLELETKAACDKNRELIERITKLEQQTTYRLVYTNDFEKDAAGWSFTGRSQAGDNNTILGGYKQTAATAFYRDFDLSAYVFSSIRVRLIYYFVDTWDGESGYVDWNGVRMFSETNVYTNHLVPLVGTGEWKDRSKMVEFEIPATDSKKIFRLAAGSTLDQGAADESFGIDNVEIWIR